MKSQDSFSFAWSCTVFVWPVAPTRYHRWLRGFAPGTAPLTGVPVPVDAVLASTFANAMGWASLSSRLTDSHAANRPQRFPSDALSAVAG